MRHVAAVLLLLALATSFSGAHAAKADTSLESLVNELQSAGKPAAAPASPAAAAGQKLLAAGQPGAPQQQQQPAAQPQPAKAGAAVGTAAAAAATTASATKAAPASTPAAAASAPAPKKSGLFDAVAAAVAGVVKPQAAGMPTSTSGKVSGPAAVTWTVQQQASSSPAAGTGDASSTAATAAVQAGSNRRQRKQQQRLKPSQAVKHPAATSWTAEKRHGPSPLHGAAAFMDAIKPKRLRAGRKAHPGAAATASHSSSSSVDPDKGTEESIDSPKVAVAAAMWGPASTRYSQYFNKPPVQLALAATAPNSNSSSNSTQAGAGITVTSSSTSTSSSDGKHGHASSHGNSKKNKRHHNKQHGGSDSGSSSGTTGDSGSDGNGGSSGSGSKPHTVPSHPGPVVWSKGDPKQLQVDAHGVDIWARYKGKETGDDTAEDADTDATADASGGGSSGHNGAGSGLWAEESEADEGYEQLPEEVDVDDTNSGSGGSGSSGSSGGGNKADYKGASKYKAKKPKGKKHYHGDSSSGQEQEHEDDAEADSGDEGDSEDDSSGEDSAEHDSSAGTGNAGKGYSGSKKPSKGGKRYSSKPSKKYKGTGSSGSGSSGGAGDESQEEAGEEGDTAEGDLSSDSGDSGSDGSGGSSAGKSYNKKKYSSGSKQHYSSKATKKYKGGSGSGAGAGGGSGADADDDSEDADSSTDDGSEGDDDSSSEDGEGDDSSGHDAAGAGAGSGKGKHYSKNKKQPQQQHGSGKKTYKKAHKGGSQQQHEEEEGTEDDSDEEAAEDGEQGEAEGGDSYDADSDAAGSDGDGSSDAEGEDDGDAEQEDEGESGEADGYKGGKKNKTKAKYVKPGGGGKHKYTKKHSKAHYKDAVIHQRIDIAEIDDMADTNAYRILLLMAFADMMACKDMSDPYGYWPLAGVHGLGWQYNGHTPGTQGFCRHSSPDFAGWHRPYVWTFEQGLIRHAGLVAQRLKTDKLRQKYGAIAPTIRLPYWDFTSPVVPHILRDSQATVIDEHGHYITISNPLARFKYPRSPGEGLSGHTVRSSKWIVGIHRGAGPWAKELASFVRSSDFGCTYNGPTRCPGNLEQIHNSIHSTLGSTEGELGKSEYAAFDPLFWLLHSAVDRCIWLFQNNNYDGGGWQDPDSYYPFDPPGNPEHVGDLGYTYRDPHSLTASQTRKLLASSPDALPDTVSGPHAGHRVGSAAAKAALQRALNQWTGGYSGYQWQVQLTNLRRYQKSNQPANVFVLLKDMPGAPALPKAQGSGRGSINPDDVRTRQDFCGSIEGFSDDAHMANVTGAVSAAVDLTDCLQRAGVQTAVDPKDPADSKSAPKHAAVKVSQLKLYALAPDGTDLTPKFDFGQAVISWTRPLQLRRSASARDAEVSSGELVVKSVGNGADETVFAQAVGYV